MTGVVEVHRLGRIRIEAFGGAPMMLTVDTMTHKDFWMFNLKSGQLRQLTRLQRGSIIGDFDVSPDGRAIVFDRTREESDIVLFGLSGR